MMALFEGFSGAYGTYDGTVQNDIKGGKLEIKQSARTVRSPVTQELWDDHLSGEAPLGIIPIRDNNTCLWGVIDVDTYGVSLPDMVESISKFELPLVTCRSKSGGAHLFLFLSDPAPAELVQARLKEMAALLGYGSAEVFPKQRIVHTERGDLGSWLNMPYFGGEETDRYGVKPGGLAMTLGEFLTAAEAARRPSEYLRHEHRVKKAKGSGGEEKGNPDFGDGPPCMQHLANVGFPQGTRNKGLFALASFAKKKYGTQWVETLERWNRDHFDPPLPSAEVQQIIKSHERKEYNYTCREHPLSSHCNSTLCRTRKYGVGGDDDFPVISGLSVLDTEPPLWFLDVDDQRLELTTDELQNFKAFHRVCMERLFRCFRMMKQDQWLQIVSIAMREAVKIDAPEEVGVSGQFYELVEQFVMNRHRGEQKEDLLVGRPWLDEEEGRHYFRLIDLMRYLESSGFKTLNRAQVTTRLKDRGGGRHFFNFKGKGVNCFYIPDTFSPVPDAPLPPIKREPI